MHEIAIDAENVFFWNRSDSERAPSPERLTYTRNCLEALAWWSDTHVGPGDAAPHAEAIRGFGKLDPAGQAHVGAVRLGGGEVRVDRVDEFLMDGISEGERLLILDADFSREVVATFTLVGPEKDAGETALLDHVSEAVASPGPHRVVLCSADTKVLAVYARGVPEGVSYLLAYNAVKRPEHVGDAGVATFSDVVSLYLNRHRLGGLVPGEELTGAVLTRFNILREPAPPSRPHRSPRRRALRAAGPVASPIDSLRRIDWAELVANPPNSPRWVAAWGDAEFQQLASRVLARELSAAATANDDLQACFEGFWSGDEGASHRAYRAVALIAVHYRQPPDRRDSLGAMLDGDPELADLREPYLLVQPVLPPLPAPEPVPA